MRFASPVLLIAAGVAAAAVVVLHLLARRQRHAEAFPTARFVPRQAAASAVRVERLRDIRVLAARGLALLLAGVAAARPSWQATSGETVRVIVVDRSRTTGAQRQAVVRSIAAGGITRVVVFDSTAREIDLAALGRDTAGPSARANLSAGLVAGIRTASTLRDRYARVELHLVSAVAIGAFDAGTSRIRDQWPDSIHVHRLNAALDTTRTEVAVDAAPGDQVMAMMQLAAAVTRDTARATVRVQRGPLLAAASIWGRTGGRRIVVWPPPLPGSTTDSVGVLVSATGTVAGYFRRSPIDSAGVPIIWWADGTVAARERPNADGCIRALGFEPSAVGDGALSLSMRTLVRRLLVPCGAEQAWVAASDSTVAALERPPLAAPTIATAAPATPPWVTALLIGLALLALLLERQFRRPAPEQA